MGGGSRGGCYLLFNETKRLCDENKNMRNTSRAWRSAHHPRRTDRWGNGEANGHDSTHVLWQAKSRPRGRRPQGASQIAPYEPTRIGGGSHIPSYTACRPPRWE